ncbi:pyruvate kinase [Candidatus Woesebacteria bacterium]|nr:pyruvate kinase [Candidatus Woesebacteria bacterium]
MNKATKIVATIGPATETVETIRELIEAGMNVARFNTKHGTPEWHSERIRRVRATATEMNVPIAILLDLQGPEIRITIPGGEAFDIAEDETVTFVPDGTSEDPRQPQIPQIVIDSLEVGHHVLIDDGLGEFEVVESTDHKLVAKALGSFPVSNRKTLNTPGAVIDLPSLIPQDLVQLDAASDEFVDYVGLSFVRNKTDIEILKGELEKRNLHAGIVAKIENQSALDNLEEIIEVSDAVMVARGDLAVEVPFKELTYWQKHIIDRCRQFAKPVITATQMLKSMVDNPRPTRAEVSDVAHAIYDGTDAVMLSEETTIGKFPVEAVATQAVIAEYNEPHIDLSTLEATYTNVGSYVTHAAINLLRDIAQSQSGQKVDKIVCLTETGATASFISRFRPQVPIHVLTGSESMYQKLSMLYGVCPHVISLPINDELESSTQLIEEMRRLDIAHSGENILLIHGTFWKKPGLTNTISFITIP